MLSIVNPVLPVSPSRLFRNELFHRFSQKLLPRIAEERLSGLVQEDDVPPVVGQKNGVRSRFKEQPMGWDPEGRLRGMALPGAMDRCLLHA